MYPTHYYTSNATVGEHKYFLSLELLGALYLVRNIRGSSPVSTPHRLSGETASRGHLEVPHEARQSGWLLVG